MHDEGAPGAEESAHGSRVAGVERGVAVDADPRHQADRREMTDTESSLVDDGTDFEPNLLALHCRSCASWLSPQAGFHHERAFTTSGSSAGMRQEMDDGRHP